MIKLVCFIHRRPGWTRDDFQRHWREHHGPLIAGIPELHRHVVRYEQNHRLESDYLRDDRGGHGVSNGDDDPRNLAAFDGATVMWFESMREYQAFATEPLYAERIAPDEAQFMDRERTMYFFSEEAEPKIGDLAEQQQGKVKLLALLARKPGLSISEFHAHWSGPHGDLFKSSPALRKNILAYQQNHRSSKDYERAPDLAWDGMAEQWYTSLDAFHAAAGDESFEQIVVPDEERFMNRAATRFILCEPAHVVLSAS